MSETTLLEHALPTNEPIAHAVEIVYDQTPDTFVLNEETAREIVQKVKDQIDWVPADARERRLIHRQVCYHTGLFFQWHKLN